MEFGILQTLMFILREMLSFVNTKVDVLLAFFLFLMGYKLFKLAIQKVNIENGKLKYRTFMVLSLPGLFISLFGTVFVINLAQINLLIMFLFGTLMTGISFAVIGYLLFIKGVFEESDIEAVWKDRSLLLKKASPGTIFGLFGVSIIVFSLWKGTAMVNNYQNSQALFNKEVISAIDRNVPEVINTMKQYFDLKKDNKEKQHLGEKETIEKPETRTD